MAITVLYSSWVIGKNYMVHVLLFLRNRLQRLCWIVVQWAELLSLLYSSWWDNAAAGKICFYFCFLLPSPPHSVFSLISSFLCISFSTYFLFLPPLGLGVTLHVPLASQVSPMQAPSSKLSAKWAVCKPQLVEHRGCKKKTSLWGVT